jgi:hypothetical protein
MNLGIPLLEKIPFREIGLKAQSLFPVGRNNEILKRIDASLLLYDNSLINTATGTLFEIVPNEDEQFTDALARVARQLLPMSDGKKHVLLLLPTADFASTTFNMNAMSEKMVRSALELQSNSLIPAYDENLLLAVNATNPEGVALWFNEKEANDLFRAFEEQNIFLSAIMPRALAMLNVQDENDKTLLINDEEGSNISFLQVTGVAIRRLLTVNKTDLEQEVFAKQWDIEINQLKGEAVKTMSSLDDWLEIRQIVTPVPEYCFHPAGAIKEEKQISLAKKSKVGMAVTACFVLLLFAPFISNWLKLKDLQTELERVQELTIEPRGLRASIFDMEEEWGALEEYPDQQVAEVLISLNEVLQGALSSFSINKGVVDISGSTDDPAYLVELLAQREEFYNVVQSTNTRGGGAQFGIRLSLSNTDFETYDENFPVVSQGR